MTDKNSFNERVTRRLRALRTSKKVSEIGDPKSGDQIDKQIDPQSPGEISWADSLDNKQENPPSRQMSSLVSDGRTWSFSPVGVCGGKTELQKWYDHIWRT